VWLTLGLIVIFVVVIRVRLLNLPLERDEGEYAYVGQLMLAGVAPYQSAYVVKLPGPAVVYALSMALFGQTPAGIRLGLLLASIAAVVLVFWLSREWFNDSVAVIAALTYALMSVSWGAVGNAAHATQFIVPVALGGVLLLLRAFRTGGPAALFGSGLLFGCAFLLKQPGLFFGFYGGLLLLGHEWRAWPARWPQSVKRIVLFTFGCALPFVILGLIVWRAGAFERFWFWTFKVAGGGWISGQQGWDDFFWYLRWLQKSDQLQFWLLGGLLLPFVFWLPPVRPVRLAFFGFCAVSLFAACLGWRFNPHYFVVTLPALGMIIGLGVTETRRFMRQTPSLAVVSFMPAAVFAVAAASSLVNQRQYFFTGNVDEVMETVYSTQPFREAAQVAEYIRKNSTPDDRIAVLGSEPEIYFDARRRAATGHMSTYILMDRRPYSHAMQEEMDREIQAAQPEFIVYVQNILSWFPPADADNTLLGRMMPYLAAGYRRVGIAVTGPEPGPPAYYWGAEAAHLPPNARPHTSYIFVFQRQHPAAGRPVKP
jgi:4-amino-4-deoxy-L-arabinose transferase-like glycosyltransferase